MLIAEACNIDLEALARRDVPALTRGRLLWVQQNYMRAETISRANARLVVAQGLIRLARAWGGGDVATADKANLDEGDMWPTSYALKRLTADVEESSARSSRERRTEE